MPELCSYRHVCVRRQVPVPAQLTRPTRARQACSAADGQASLISLRARPGREPVATSGWRRSACSVSEGG